MLYFTFSNKNNTEIHGTFSGRFAFKKENYSNMESTIGLVNAIEKSQINHYEEHLQHEKIHHFICQYSNLNRYLVGLRFFSRFDFSKGNHLLVQQYYYQRTIYFLLSYEVHEYLVKRIERRIGKQNEQVRVIEDLNNIVKSSMYRSSVYCLDKKIIKIVHILDLNSFSKGKQFISFVLGFIATRTFTAILSVNESDSTNKDKNYGVIASSKKEGYLSRYFGFNVNGNMEITKFDAFYTKIYKKILNYFNVERFFKVNWSEEMLIAWTYNKFLAEYYILNKIFELNSSNKITDKKVKIFLQHALNQKFNGNIENYFKNYLYKILNFSVSGYYLRIDDLIIYELYQIVDVIIDAICTKKSIEEFLLIINDEQKNILGKAGGFFYYHGN